MRSTNDSYNLVSPHETRIAKRCRKKSESFVTDGILSSYDVVEEFDKFGDEGTHFRDLSLRSIIKAQSVDLLQPLGALPYDQLKAADKLGEFTGTFDSLAQDFDSLKKCQAKISEVTPTPSETK